MVRIDNESRALGHQVVQNETSRLHGKDANAERLAAALQKALKNPDIANVFGRLSNTDKQRVLSVASRALRVARHANPGLHKIPRRISAQARGRFESELKSLSGSALALAEQAARRAQDRRVNAPPAQAPRAASPREAALRAEARERLASPHVRGLARANLPRIDKPRGAIAAVFDPAAMAQPMPEPNAPDMNTGALTIGPRNPLPSNIDSGALSVGPAVHTPKDAPAGGGERELVPIEDVLARFEAHPFRGTRRNERVTLVPIAQIFAAPVARLPDPESVPVVWPRSDAHDIDALKNLRDECSRNPAVAAGVIKFYKAHRDTVRAHHVLQTLTVIGASITGGRTRVSPEQGYDNYRQLSDATQEAISNLPFIRHLLKDEHLGDALARLRQAPEAAQALLPQLDLFMSHYRLASAINRQYE